jgi:DNA mismatch repair protein MutS
MLQQYFRAKEAHPGVLMAMRVGDFYEFYGEDAEVAAAALEITLTAREDGKNGKVAMAGVPYHSVEKYLARLLQKGLKVALCDQVEDPKQAKGLVRRAVTRVLTPGTLIEDSMLSAGQNNFLAAVCLNDGKAGLATLDTSTGEFLVTEIEGEDWSEFLIQEIARIRPSELLTTSGVEDLVELARQTIGFAVSPVQPPDSDRADRELKEKFGVANLAAFGCDQRDSAKIAAAMILGYARANGLVLDHVDALATYSVHSFMCLDAATQRSLEIFQNLSEGTKRFSLLSVLDATVTAMGARLLRQWLSRPLLDRDQIRDRHDCLEAFVAAALLRGDLREALQSFRDIERLVSRCVNAVAGPRDLAALRDSLRAIPRVQEPLARIARGRLQTLSEQVVDHSTLVRLLETALVADPPHLARDGGVIAEGHDPNLDHLRDLASNGRNYIADLERSEREATGIPSLRVGYNAVFGYYLEVTKAHLDKVPAHYIRKQTTANAERYITAQLKEYESSVLSAQDQAIALETDLFHRLRCRVAQSSNTLLATARALAELDVLCALAEVASRRGFVRPEVTDGSELEIVGGRHPVVEAHAADFVPNDTRLALPAEQPHETATVIILTGPNMSGKSTYLRQTALIALLAQVGSFVPARSCRLGVCDRIFARIGAKDELALGQSTFMVEMLESANILHHATPQSLVILDEIGRGTSTFDGLAIAWAMVEFLADLGARTLFATHYHQLNAIAEQIPSVANFRVSVEEVHDKVIWTHKVLPGGTDRSYGIHVARMAGMPARVLDRAAEVLRELEQTEAAPVAIRPAVANLQMTLFEAEPPAVVKALAAVDVERLTPLEALQLLDEWKRTFGTPSS